MPSVYAFLRQRYDEEEGTARQLQAATKGVNGYLTYDHYQYDGDTTTIRKIKAVEPSRVLADLKVKRSLLDVAEAGATSPYTSWLTRQFIHPMAAVYSDHPDFSKEWA